MSKGNGALGGARAVLSVLAALAVPTLSVWGQGARVREEPPRTPKEVAPVDLTGDWDAIVVEDWRYRMLPPLRYQDDPPRLGEQYGVPINAAGREVALAWNPAADEAAGEACKAYGAPNVMRLPGRIRITWQDDSTLRLDTEAGTQTRLLEFGSPTAQAASWQGMTRASWPRIPAGAANAPSQLFTGSLLLETSGLRSGYLLKNGIPYSANTTMTEYLARVDDENGDAYLIVTTTVTDPTYLREPYLTTTHFKKISGRSGWNPSPCSAR